MPILARSVFLELIKITVLSLVALSAVLMIGGAMVEAARQGLPPTRVIALAPYLVPPTLPFTLPLCVLLACTIVYGRLSANLEIVALKSCGVSMTAIMWPGIVLAGAAAAAGVFMADQLIPACHRDIAQRVLADAQASLCAYLKAMGALIEPDVPYEIYVRDVKGDRLLDPLFKHRGPDGGYDLVIQASEAVVRMAPPVDKESGVAAVNLRMKDGAMFSPFGPVIYFTDRTERLPLPESTRREDKDIAALDLLECLARSGQRRAQSKTLDFELAEGGVRSLLVGNLEGWAGDVRVNRVRSQRYLRKSREAAAQVHLRLAQTTVVLPFVLLGCPISVLLGRRDFLQRFFLCFLPIVTLYYPLVVLGYNIIKEGKWLPTWSVWLPSLVLIALAAPILRQTIKH